jgi:hypothetical protein
MKKAFLLLAFFATISFVAEKYITIRFSEPQIQYHWANLEQIKFIVNQSSMPHNQVVYIIGSIDSLQKNIQENVKIDSTIIK